MRRPAPSQAIQATDDDEPRVNLRGTEAPQEENVRLEPGRAPDHAGDDNETALARRSTGLGARRSDAARRYVVVVMICVRMRR